MPSDSNEPKDEKPAPVEQDARGISSQLAIATELPFVLISALVLGGLVGFFLDRWLHTKPFLMLVFGFLGFLAGLRDVLRRLSKQ
jgi:ATP synthase protein I